MPDDSPLAPDFSREATLMASGRLLVAGVDEAGRGPLAGPVVTAAVILDPNRIPVGLNDSKKLSLEQRETLYEAILATATVAITMAPPSIILSRNIRGATLWAMRRSVVSLGLPPSHVLVDGRDVPPGLPCPADAVIGGDGLSVSIAAASIVAKVTRDRLCAIMDCDSPDFGFAGHKGYSTPEHLRALQAHGPCRHHREEFAPVVAARDALSMRRAVAA